MMPLRRGAHTSRNKAKNNPNGSFYDAVKALSTRQFASVRLRFSFGSFYDAVKALSTGNIDPEHCGGYRFGSFYDAVKALSTGFVHVPLFGGKSPEVSMMPLRRGALR